MTQRDLLRALFEAAIASAQPSVALPPHLPEPASIKGRLIVIGAGKASAAMARAVETHWAAHADRISGLVITRLGYSVPCERIEIVQASHPVPDQAGLQAAARIAALVQGLSADDFVLCLLSGGGSALMPAPAEGLSLTDKQSINSELLKSGASIGEINCVRRHLSTLKGGRLAALCQPARVLTLLISDVPGDELTDIASGPTVADPSTCADALAVLRRYRITVPEVVRTLLESGRGETLKPGDPRLSRCQTRLISSPQIGLEAAARVARQAGYAVGILGDSLEGEAREVGRVLAGIALQTARYRQPLPPPCILLSGGETTVTVRGQGRGGRNVECLLALALSLKGQAGIWALAADTDGVDGAEEIAGALIAPDTLERARAIGVSAAARLDDNDGHGFFGALGDSIITGPTLTNINDFRAILIEKT
ncbi:MAG: glycerate kinase [Betaproteobacteria bacterium]